MDEIAERHARRIANDDVGKVIAEITQAAEDASGALSAMIATGTRWEKWWQGVITVGLTNEPWSRCPGRAHDGSTLQLERSLTPKKGTAYARTARTASGKKPSRKHVDIVVAREPSVEAHEHLIELKLLKLASTKAERERTLKEIREKDIKALSSVTNGVEELGSAWAVILAFSPEKRRFTRRMFEDLDGDARWDAEPIRITLRAEGFVAWVIGKRVA